MKSHDKALRRLSFWQLVFLQSKVNGVTYHGEHLARYKWTWPQDTYFQQRLFRANWYRVPDDRKLN